MKTTQLFTVLLLLAGGALAQGSSESPIATDRPGFLFSSLTVGGRVVQAELGLPQVALFEGGEDIDEVELRTTSLVGLARLGVGDDFELRLGAPFYNEARAELLGYDVQIDPSFDRGLTDDSADWLLGLGLSARFD